jgi:hypothetical protein
VDHDVGTIGPLGHRDQIAARCSSIVPAIMGSRSLSNRNRAWRRRNAVSSGDGSRSYRPRAVYDMAAPRYVQFVGTEISSATEGPIDPSLLVAFVELVKKANH